MGAIVKRSELRKRFLDAALGRQRTASRNWRPPRFGGLLQVEQIAPPSTTVGSPSRYHYWADMVIGYEMCLLLLYAAFSFAGRKTLRGPSPVPPSGREVWSACMRGATFGMFQVRRGVSEGRDGCGRSPYCRCWR